MTGLGEGYWKNVKLNDVFPQNFVSVYFRLEGVLDM